MTPFGFKKGARLKGGLDPQVTGEALADIRERRDGKLDPQDVVDVARHDNALHGAFEWDDSVAGEAFRRDQARNLIRAVVILVEELDAPEQPAFVHIRIVDDDGERHSYYQDAEIAAGNPDERASVLRELRGNISSCIGSLARFERLIGENRATATALKSLEELRAGLDS